MRFTVYFLCVVIFLGAGFFGCSGQNTDVSETEKPAPPQPALSSGGAAGMQSSESVLVTFVELGSVNCVPCKMMQPIMDEIEEEYAGQVHVVFHDVWTPEGRPFAQKYGIRVIPTQVFLDKDGVEYFRHEGFFPKEDLVKVLEQQGVQKTG